MKHIEHYGRFEWRLHSVRPSSRLMAWEISHAWRHSWPPRKSARFAAGPNEFRSAELTKNRNDWFVVIRSVWSASLWNSLSHILVGPPFKFLTYIRFCVFLFCHHHHSVIAGHRPSAEMGRMPSSSRIHVSSVPMLPSECTTFGSMAIVAPMGSGRSNPRATTGDSSS